MIKNEPQKVKELITKANKILILISGPDGDSIGASLALKQVLERQEKQVTLISGNPFNQRPDLPFVDQIQVKDPHELDFSNYDLTITIDAANETQLADKTKHSSFTIPHPPPTVAIDHHRSYTGYADYAIFNSQASSCCELVYTHFYQEQQPTPEEATLLLFGLSTDTGHFKWSLGPNTFLTAEKLLAAGANINQIISLAYFNYSKKTLEIVAEFIKRTEYYPKQHLMITAVIMQNLDDLGWTHEEYKTGQREFQTIFSRSVKDYHIGILLLEKSNGTVDGSARGDNFYNKIDISQLGGRLGGSGGGHFHSAGFTVDGNIEQIKQKIIELLPNSNPTG